MYEITPARTLANLVLPQMRGNLSATQEEISWVITLNLVADLAYFVVNPRMRVQ